MILSHPKIGRTGLHFSIINLGFSLDYYFGQIKIWIYEPPDLLSEIALIFFRFVFVHHIILLYKGRTALKRTFLLGILVSSLSDYSPLLEI
jgi:hypothetical protein